MKCYPFSKISKRVSYEENSIGIPRREIRKKNDSEEDKGMETSAKETVLVTGATGFLGGYLIKRLTKKYRVLALGRNREKGKKLEEYGAVFCPGDFTRREKCNIQEKLAGQVSLARIALG